MIQSFAHLPGLDPEKKPKYRAPHRLEAAHVSPNQVHPSAPASARARAGGRRGDPATGDKHRRQSGNGSAPQHSGEHLGHESGSATAHQRCGPETRRNHADGLESFVAGQLREPDGAVCAEKNRRVRAPEKPTGRASCQTRRDMATSNLFNKGSVNESRKVHQPYPNARASARTSGENPAPSSRHENGELSSSGSAGSAGNEGLRRNAASSP